MVNIAYDLGKNAMVYVKYSTGVIAGLLLDLAGVARTDIVHNYAIYAHYLEDSPRTAR